MGERTFRRSSNPGRPFIAAEPAAGSRRSAGLATLSAPRSPGAGPPVSGDTGRAAVGRAGSFNSESGKNYLDDLAGTERAETRSREQNRR